MGQVAHVVAVFGSSRPAPGEPEYAAAYAMGRELALAGFTVCNGGYGGIMEASARGAKEAAVPPDGFAGRTIGVVASAFGEKKANMWIDTVVQTETLIDRLLKLMSISDAYVVLKGGTGTLLEFAAVWEFMNKKIMRPKPVVLVGNFWEGVVHTVKNELPLEGLSDCTRFVSTAEDPPECVKILKNALQPSGGEETGGHT